MKEQKQYNGGETISSTNVTEKKESKSYHLDFLIYFKIWEKITSLGIYNSTRRFRTMYFYLFIFITGVVFPTK